MVFEGGSENGAGTNFNLIPLSLIFDQQELEGNYSSVLNCSDFLNNTSLTQEDLQLISSASNSPIIEVQLQDNSTINCTIAQAPTSSPEIPQQGCFDCTNVYISDDQIFITMWVSLIAGAFFVLLFSILHQYVRIYRTRLILAQVSMKPPPLQRTGFFRFFYWVVPTITTKEKDVLATAGLDALMFLRIQVLGMEIFLPLAIIGCAVLIPIHHNGDYLEEEWVKQHNEAQNGNRDVITLSELMKYTMSNISPNSPIFWLHVVLIIIFSIYVMWLLKRHYQSYVMLQQHYFTMGDDPNYWLIHHQMGVKKVEEEVKIEHLGKEKVPKPTLSNSSTLRQLTQPSNWLSKASKLVQRFHNSDLKNYVQVPMGPATQVTAALSRNEEYARLNTSKDSAGGDWHSGEGSKKHPGGRASMEAGSFNRPRVSLDFRNTARHSMQLELSPMRPEQAASNSKLYSTSENEPHTQQQQLNERQGAPINGIIDEGTDRHLSTIDSYSLMEQDEIYLDVDEQNELEQALEDGNGNAKRRGKHRRRRTQQEEDMLNYLEDAEKVAAEHDVGASNQGTSDSKHSVKTRQTNESFDGPEITTILERPSTPSFSIGDLVRPSDAPPQHKNNQRPPPIVAPKTSPAAAGMFAPVAPASSSQGFVPVISPGNESVTSPPPWMGSTAPAGPPASSQQPPTSFGSSFMPSIHTFSAPPVQPEAVDTVSHKSHPLSEQVPNPKTKSKKSGDIDEIEVHTGSLLSDLKVRPQKSGFRALSLQQQTLMGLPPSEQHISRLPQPDGGLRRASVVTSYGGKTYITNQELQWMTTPNDRGVMRLSSHSCLFSQTGSMNQRLESGNLSEINTVIKYEAVPRTREEEPAKHQLVTRWWEHGTPDDPEFVEVKKGTVIRYDKRSAMASKPSVRFRKTVNVRTPELDVISVNAQNYAVLVTDVPRLDVKRTAQQAGIYNTFSNLVDILWVRKEDMRRRPAKKKSKWAVVKKSVKTGEIFGNQQLVKDTFERLFPEDFTEVVPIKKHKQLDLLLLKWDQLQDQHEHADAKFQKLGIRPRHSVLCGCCGMEVDSIEFYKNQLSQIEKEIERVRKEINNGPATSSYFVLFRSQKAATIAAQTILHPEDGHSFQTHPAPGPDEVNWQALWRHWRERDLRMLAALPFYVILMFIPLGVFAGALTQLSSTVCSLVQEDCTNELGQVHWENCDNPFTFYCTDDQLINLVSAFLPSIFVALWQNLVMPHSLYYLAQVESKSFSLSALDRRIAFLFFMWDMFNIFLGGAIGGSITQSLKTAIRQPGDIFKILGESMPNSSNFFLNYVVLRAFAFVPLRMVLPHGGVWRWLFRCGGKCGCVMTERDVAMTYAPSSIRYGREFGIMMLIFLIGLAYAVVSPLILPFAFVYFLLSWLVWRYQIIYVYVRSYESGGKMWPGVFRQLVWCLFIFVFWSFCVLIVKEAYYQSVVVIVVVTPLIFHFMRYCSWRFEKGTMVLPLEIANEATDAYIDPLIYTPPALRPQSAGWHPEVGKAWESWGMPMYTV